MILFWLLLVVLVLGGLVAWQGGALHVAGLWLRSVRAAPVRLPVCQRREASVRPRDLRGHPLPLPRVVTRAGPPPRPLT
jgi:hypothetical protein